MRNDNSPASLIDFDAWGAWLRGKVRQGRKVDEGTKDAPPLRSTYGALRYHPYGYLYELAQKKKLDDLIAHVGIRPGPAGGGALAVLRLMESGRRELLTPSTRSRVAEELEFALKHRIEPLRVLGFLYEVGSQRAILAAHSGNSTPEAVARYGA